MLFTTKLSSAVVSLHSPQDQNEIPAFFPRRQKNTKRGAALTLAVGERLAFTTTLVLLICGTFLYYAFEASGSVVLLSGLLLNRTSDLYRLPMEEIKIN